MIALTRNSKGSMITYYWVYPFTLEKLIRKWNSVDINPFYRYWEPSGEYTKRRHFDMLTDKVGKRRR